MPCLFRIYAILDGIPDLTAVNFAESNSFDMRMLARRDSGALLNFAASVYEPWLYSIVSRMYGGWGGTSTLKRLAWVFAALLVSGLCMIVAGKALQAPLSVVHKLLALLCLVLLLRNAGAFRAFAGQPHLPAAQVVFAAACLAAFATGVVQSIPTCASALWLNLHRVAAAAAAIACIVAVRLIAIAVRA